jgi:hypothetical protein
MRQHCIERGKLSDLGSPAGFELQELGAKQRGRALELGELLQQRSTGRVEVGDGARGNSALVQQKLQVRRSSCARTVGVRGA